MSADDRLAASIWEAERHAAYVRWRLRLASTS
jgi:hypothetical protein